MSTQFKIETEDQFIDARFESNECERFANDAISRADVERIRARQIELRRAIDASPFAADEYGNIIPKANP